MMDDHALLHDYAERRSEEAFAELVGRYLDLVYSAALRVVGETHLAQDVAQSVFMRLARKAGTLPKETVLAAWLHRHAHFAACNTLRAERRQRQHATVAMELNTLKDDADSVWRQLAPRLEEVMSDLDRQDHEAVVLRFLENKSLRDVGAALGLSEDAAQKRVARAVEKLRVLFARRGIGVSAAGLVCALGTHAVQAAPAGLAASILTASVAATSGAAAAGLTVNLIETLAMTKLKTVAATAAILAVASIPVILEHRANARLRREISALRQPAIPAAPARSGGPIPLSPEAPRPAAPAKVFNWQTVESTDYRAYVGNLRAIGCPEETIRDIIRADVKKLFDDRVRNQLPATNRFEYWKPGSSVTSLVNDDFVNRQKDLAIEKHLLLKALLGTDASAEPDLSGGLHLFETVLDFMTPEKRSQVLEVELLNVGRLAAASDGASAARAQAEKEQFLNTILTPEEKFDYDVRLSPTAIAMQMRLGGFEPTESEFREMVRLQKQFDDGYGAASQTGSTADARAAAQKELQNETRKLLGDDRYRQYVNEQNWAGSSLRNVAEQYQIPKETAFKVFDLTDAAKEEAGRIRADALLSQAQKQAALDVIRDQTEQAVSAVIGSAAAQTYISRGSAVRNLNRLSP